MSLKNYVIIDVETTTRENGNPFVDNRLCTVQYKLPDQDPVILRVEYGDEPDPDAKQILESVIAGTDGAPILVGVNIKFDLHWLRAYLGLSYVGRRVWDISTAHFIHSGQRAISPSMDSIAEEYGFPVKPTPVRQYWERGYDTTDIPWPILREYCAHDVVVTEQLYLHQLEVLSPEHRRLTLVHGADLLVLAEMEWNGLPFNKERAAELAANAEKKIKDIDAEIFGILKPSFEVNWNSNDHLSALLYGGELPIRQRTQYIRELKKGPVVREKWDTVYQEVSGIMPPPRRFETAGTAGMSDEELAVENRKRVSEGKKKKLRFYSTAEPVLRMQYGKASKKARKVIDLLLERSKIEKLRSTYYQGLTDLCEQNGWKDGVIHGQFNQTVAVTGRLSSSRPNLQNLAGEAKYLFESTYRG